jgi:hypothetical protein
LDSQLLPTVSQNYFDYHAPSFRGTDPESIFLRAKAEFEFVACTVSVIRSSGLYVACLFSKKEDASSFVSAPAPSQQNSPLIFTFNFAKNFTNI